MTTLAFQEDELVASICKESFKDFVYEFWGEIIADELVWNWHIPYICDRLQNIAERVFRGEPRKKDIIINIPPGTTKSTLCSVMFPIWVWTRMPKAQTICSSYSADLALDLASKSRDIVWSPKFQRCFPEIEIREDARSKRHFQNTEGGWRHSTGVGGMITGFHGHFIIIDDPIDPNAALSEADLKAVNHWMTDTIPKRKVDKSITPTVLIMQRLHQEDPSGKWIERTPEMVKHICLPAEKTEDVKPKHLRRRYKDGLLDPTRLSMSILKEAKLEGEYSYAGQYLQRPTPPGGGMFKVDNFRVKKVAPPMNQLAKVVRYWDKAGTEGGGAATAGVKIGRDKHGNFYVLDVVQGHWGISKRDSIIRATAEKDGQSVIQIVEQEPGSGGKESAINTIRLLEGFPVRRDPVGQSDGNKIQRAEPFASAVNNGLVYLVEAPWNHDYIEELRFFWFGSLKDRVDASSGAYNFLTLKRVARVV